MKVKSISLLMALLFLSVSFAGLAIAADHQETKIVLSGVNENHTVTLYNNDYITGVSIRCKMVGDSLYILADNALPLVDKWSYREEINTSKVVINNGSHNEVTISTGNRNYIDLEGAAQGLTDTIKTELQKGYFPLRFVYELGGYKVNYDPSQNSITFQ
ncbi:hypothetical protein [Paenibacillus agricola]|uniref:Copper amine oxidase-like N-terminal domain-containing protein n=1 Tax=Paenibacillus agricola TaxID=2716264 RepID=A0ABX0JG32_9BACL|nr:hypothetical protein [Paenibacillus agricola]NHN35527.1 hypothetical protein [Paenibacillus agricola]